MTRGLEIRVLDGDLMVTTRVHWLVLGVNAFAGVRYTGFVDGD